MGEGHGDNLLTISWATSLFYIVFSLLAKSFLFLCLSYLIKFAFRVGEDPANLFAAYALCGVLRFIVLDRSFSLFSSLGGFASFYFTRIICLSGELFTEKLLLYPCMILSSADYKNYTGAYIDMPKSGGLY